MEGLARPDQVLWRLCEGKDPEALVFDHEAGAADLTSDLYRRFVNASKRTGLPKLSFHDLRHTFGTQAIRKFKIHEVQRMMGHRHITTTERYLHYTPDPDPDPEAVAKLVELWGERGGARAGAPTSAPAAEVIPLRNAA